VASIREGNQSALALFAAELAAAREAAGISQDELAARINYSHSLIAMIESMKRVPTLDVARRCDSAFSTPGTFVRLQQHARTTPLPSWFRPWAEIEAVAQQIRMFEHALVPGLLQTEDYARAVLATRPNTTDAEVDELVTARMERQQVLDRPDPPLAWVVIDERVLHAQIGAMKVMHGQLLQLADMSARPNITVEVVPFSAGAHSGLLGACAIADMENGDRVVYLETMTEGFISESPAVVARTMLTFDTLRSEALPRSASRDLITKTAEELWT
jgi:transcriptional regulator with XRE-family HTH domain